VDEAFRADTLDDVFASYVVEDDALARGLAEGTLAVDMRLRDALRGLRRHDGSFALWPGSLPFPGGSIQDEAAFAAEVSRLLEVDGIVRAERRVETLESRVVGLRTLLRR
jgi:hypothetical protein